MPKTPKKPARAGKAKPRAKATRSPAPARDDTLARTRALALGLPEAHEVTAWEAPTFRVKNKMFAMFVSADSGHQGGRPAVWIKAGPGNQELLVQAHADRCFVPPYVGPSGWVGVYLDRRPSWTFVRELLEDGWTLVAPKKLLK